MFTQILVPTDFSEPSDAALDYARAMAEAFGASLHLLHVIEPGYASGMVANEVYISESPGIYDVVVKEAQAKLAVRVMPNDRARYRATSEVIVGHTAPTIVHYAADHGTQLIVMGTHGRTGLAHLLMGSVAEHVVRQAPCPVLTVRAALVPAGVTASRESRISRSGIAPDLG